MSDEAIHGRSPVSLQRENKYKSIQNGQVKVSDSLAKFQVCNDISINGDQQPFLSNWL